MTSQPQPENEREKERRAIRLQELEQEMFSNEQQTPFYQTRKQNLPENSLKNRFRKLIKIAKFLATVIVASAFVIAIFRLSVWFTHALIIGVIALIAYKIILDERAS